MTDRNKWAFWLFILALFLAASLPSSFLLDAIRRYRGALAGFEPRPLPPLSVRFTPHREPDVAAPNLEFAPFRLKAAKASAVELIGDFNGWKAGTLALKRSAGAWEVLVPLPPGRYRYLFLVDGRPRKDPAAGSAVGPDGQDASVRVIP